MASILDILKSARHNHAITVHQRSIIVLQSARHRRIAKS